MKKILNIIANFATLPLIFAIAQLSGFYDLWIVSIIAIILQIVISLSIFYELEWWKKVLLLVINGAWGCSSILLIEWISELVNKPTGFMSGLGEAILALAFGWLNFTVIVPVLTYAFGFIKKKIILQNMHIY